MEIQMEKCKWCGINFEWDESMSKFCDIYDDNNYFDNLIFKERLNKELSKRGVV